MWQNGVVMRDWPNGAELLDLARETSGVEVDQPYLRQAQDIAAREEAAGMAPLIAERDRLIEFYGETANLAEPIAQALMRLNARFARDLRSYNLDKTLEIAKKSVRTNRRTRGFLELRCSQSRAGESFLNNRSLRDN